LKIAIEGGNLRIVREGRERKFVNRVQQKTFSGTYAASLKLPVMYITERCVFTLCEKGVKLMEIAPGIDLQRDILDQMDFKPIIAKKTKRMDERIFLAEPMGLKEDLLNLPLDDRLVYHPEENLFFVNFENFYIRSRSDIRLIQKKVEQILAPLGKKVNTIVNYDNFNILPELVDDYSDMVKHVMKYYRGVTRYTTSTFLRMKLGDELKIRRLAPYIYDSQEKARKALTEQ
jgi:propionate CoA-transferase